MQGSKGKLLIYFSSPSYSHEVAQSLLHGLQSLSDFSVGLLAAVPKDQPWPEDKATKLLFVQYDISYGERLKLGLFYAVRNHFDAVVVLNELTDITASDILKMSTPILAHQADLVLASPEQRPSLFDRFVEWRKPSPKESFLRTYLNTTKACHRAYAVRALATVPFAYNSDDFAFDTDIAIQFALSQKSIQTLAITSSSAVPSFRQNTGFFIASFVSCLLSKTQERGFWYHPKFDFYKGNDQYVPKFGFNSSHQFALSRIKTGSIVVDLGCGPGFMARELGKRDVKVVSVDRHILLETRKASDAVIETNLDDFDFCIAAERVDTILALDILEHLRFPEAFLKRMRENFSTRRPLLIATTGNVAFFILRLSLLLGKFNYGKRGVLDLDHTRLFTFSSFRKFLEREGYEITEERGIPIPFPLVFGEGMLSRLLLRINEGLIRLSKGLFSYQIGVVARIRPTLTHLMTESS